jgi:hypothetical protein
VLVAKGFGTGVVCYTGNYLEIVTINHLVNRIEDKKANVLEQLITVICRLFIDKQEGLDALSTTLVSAVARSPKAWKPP